MIHASIRFCFIYLVNIFYSRIVLFVLRLSYFMAMALTSVAFVIEKKEGLYNRALVAGR
jgi:hypothetical protein